MSPKLVTIKYSPTVRRSARPRAVMTLAHNRAPLAVGGRPSVYISVWAALCRYTVNPWTTTLRKGTLKQCQYIYVCARVCACLMNQRLAMTQTIQICRHLLNTVDNK